jgi:hypothetical protein
MGMAVCANCGEGMTITRLACDYCGWEPASSKARENLEIYKRDQREIVAKLKPYEFPKIED